jgi:outer membrane protein assembly factor BamB
MIGGPLFGSLLLCLWWLAASRVPWRSRLVGVALFLAAIVATGYAVHDTMKSSILFFALPTVTTGVIVAMLLTTRVDWHRRRWVLAITMFALFAVWTLFRMDGMDGSMAANFVWRWSTTAEQRFLDESGALTELAAASDLELPAEPGPDDWPAFRGRRRDGHASAAAFTTNWHEQPPQELWRRRVGPGWSSFCVIGDFAFTQEQQGEAEAVVCYRLQDGEPVWINQLSTRFFEAVGGAGPRATPTFHAGRLYTTGANGAVQCLDAATGHVVWHRELVEDVGAKVPQWAFSSSPLIVGNVAVVFAGGAAGKAVVAYDLDSGDVVWTTGEGKMSYSSPHLARFDDTEMILMATENGLFAMEPGRGEILWQHDWTLPGMRVVQPAMVADDRILLAGAYGGGSRLLRVERAGDGWDVSEIWTSKYLDPYFNDFVVHNGFAYGFSGQIFCCIDLDSGKRAWKGGRYGYGQVLLLSARDLLLIAAENGDAVLVAADPAEHRELGRFPAIQGKTWNHPVVANDRLLIRNGEEAACFELTRE